MKRAFFRVSFAAGMAAALFSLAAMATAREDLTAFTRDLKGLEGQFVQKVYDSEGRLKESSSGRVALSAPRLFRWEYLKPHPQLIVADGKKVWVYDPDLQQVTVRSQGAEEQNSPLMALFDPRRLEQDFRVAEAGNEGGLDWLLLNPRNEEQASFQSARLGFGPGGLVQMRVVDTLGQRTDIAFSGWKRNPGFAEGTFRFAPPKGVDVIGEN